MQMPKRHVTTAAVMGISTDRKESLPDSAKEMGSVRHPRDTPTKTLSVLSCPCSRPSPVGIPHRDREKQEGIMPAVRSDSPKNTHGPGQLL